MYRIILWQIDSNIQYTLESNKGKGMVGFVWKRYNQSAKLDCFDLLLITMVKLRSTLEFLVLVSPLNQYLKTLSLMLFDI